jgi:methionine sulfoxide reductase heme-binding subunit
VIRWFKVVVFLASLVPLGMLAWRALHSDLGANPLEVITHTTGDWTLRFLVFTLAVTPLRQITKQYWLIKFRRMLGLYAFFYGLLHFTTYLWFDKFFDWNDIVKDIGKRPFITIGFAALVIMVPLALTSTAGMIRRLGKKWQALHRLVYASAIAGVIHYYWLVKADVRKPVFYGALLGVLLFYRAAVWLKPRLRNKTAPLPARVPNET